MWGDADHRPWRRAGYHGRAPRCIASTPQALRYGQQASAVSFTQKALCNPSTSFFAWRAQHYPFRSSCPGWLRTAFICLCLGGCAGLGHRGRRVCDGGRAQADHAPVVAAAVLPGRRAFAGIAVVPAAAGAASGGRQAARGCGVMATPW